MASPDDHPDDDRVPLTRRDKIVLAVAAVIIIAVLILHGVYGDPRTSLGLPNTPAMSMLSGQSPNIPGTT